MAELQRLTGDKARADAQSEASAKAREQVLEAVGDLTRPEAATLLARLAYELRTGRTPASLLPPKLAMAPREPAPCGTEAAYRRHLKAREPVDWACRNHMRTLSAEWTRRQRRAGSRA